MSDNLEENNLLLDEDQALDFILYKDVNQKKVRDEQGVPWDWNH